MQQTLKGAEGISLCIAFTPTAEPRSAAGRQHRSLGYRYPQRRGLSHRRRQRQCVGRGVRLKAFPVSAGRDKMVRVWSFDGKEKIKPIACKDVPTCVGVARRRAASSTPVGMRRDSSVERGQRRINRRSCWRAGDRSLASPFRPTANGWPRAGANRANLGKRPTNLSSGRAAGQRQNGLGHRLTLMPMVVSCAADKVDPNLNAADKKTIYELTGQPIRAPTFTDGGRNSSAAAKTKQ